VACRKLRRLKFAFMDGALLVLVLRSATIHGSAALAATSGTPAAAVGRN